MSNTTDNSTGADDGNETARLYAFYYAWLPYSIAFHMMWRYCTPIILALGIFGNTMTILIMHRMPETSLTIFFKVLAYCDQLLLLVGLIPMWLSRVYGVLYIKNLGLWACKLYPALMLTVGTLSPWMLVALTMQRAASVLWPHRVNAVWTRAKSRVVVAVLVVIFLLIHSHFLYGQNVDEVLCEHYFGDCCPLGVSDAYAWFFDMVWPWLDLAEFCIVPFLLLILSNAALVWKLAGSVRAGQHLPVQQSTQESRQRKASSLTVTLVTVSVSFLLLMAPLNIATIAKPLVDTPENDWDGALQGQYLVWWGAGSMMWYANSSVNFYLYCLTGAKFRAEFLTMMRQVFHVLSCRRRGVLPDQSNPTKAGVGLDVGTKNGHDKMEDAAVSDF